MTMNLLLGTGKITIVFLSKLYNNTIKLLQNQKKSLKSKMLCIYLQNNQTFSPFRTARLKRKDKDECFRR